MSKSIKELFDLSGKVAIVTGGAGYLGGAISEALCEAGANVVVASRNVSKCEALAESLALKFGIKTLGAYLDIADRSSIEKCFTGVETEFSKIDILVNNAYFGAAASFENMTDEDWQKGIEGSVNGVFRCCQAAVPFFKNGGSIINISSMYGLVSPNPEVYPPEMMGNPANYGAGKAAILQLTRYLACHLAPKNIRVNSISPGAFPNPEVQKNIEFIDRLNKKIPLGRIGSPYELKGVVVFLSSQASSYVTGSNIIIDGGWTAW